MNIAFYRSALVFFKQTLMRIRSDHVVLFQDVVNQLKEHAYDKLDSIQFDHEIKDNYPIPLSTTTNTSIGGEASVPLIGTLEPNPSDFPTTCQY